MTNDEPEGTSLFAEQLAHLDARLDEITAHIDALTARLNQIDNPDAGTTTNATIAPWVFHTPPAAAEHPPHRDQTPRFTIDNFVTWYNTIYVGAAGTTAKAIPDCWPEHPALAAEIATLAYSWHHSHVGRATNAIDAQLWHHHTRPGFAYRMATEWTHPHCHDGRHKPTGAPAQADRHNSSTTGWDGRVPTVAHTGTVR